MARRMKIVLWVLVVLLSLPVITILPFVLAALPLVLTAPNTGPELLESNWEISVPTPESITEIVSGTEFRDYRDYEVWSYDGETLQDILEKDGYVEITDETNTTEIKRELETFDFLLYGEDKQRYNELANGLLLPGNFILHREKRNGDSVLILIVDLDEGELHYFRR